MRILFLDQYSEMGGAQRCLVELAPAFRGAGWEIHAAVTGQGPLVQALERRAIRVHTVPMHSFSAGRKTLLDGFRFFTGLAPLVQTLEALVDSIKPAVLYVNGPRLMPAVALARFRIPVIFHAHHHLTAANGVHLVGLALRQTGATVIAATRFVARRWGPAAAVVYGGVEPPEPGWRRVPAAGPRVGLIARIDPRKCQKEFVLAAAYVHLEFADAEFHLYGDVLFGDRVGARYKREVLSAAGDLVHYAGWQGNVYDALANLDLLVAPSRSEGGIPFVILEAFAAGVPVLASPAGDIGEVIEDGRTGFLLPSTAPESIAACLRRLLRQPSLLAEAGRAGRELWRAKFTADRFRSEILEIVHRAAGSETSLTPVRSGPG